MWAIDEYAMILRNCVWLRPPQPPITIDASDINKSMFVFIDE